MSTSTLPGIARPVVSSRSRPRLARLASAVTGAAAVLLLVGASTIGLHDWADAQLDDVAVHAAPAAGSDV